MAKQTMPMEERLAVRPDEAAAMIGICRSTIYNLLRKGEIGYSQIGRRRVIPKENITEYLKKTKIKGNAN